MTNLVVIENKASAVKKYLKILERYQSYRQDELATNVDIRGAVERYLYLVCQTTVDLAEALLAYRKFRKPTSLSDTFYILQEENIISPELTDKLVRMTGFRNAIAHDYENFDYQIAYDVLHHRLSDIKEFLKVLGVHGFLSSLLSVCLKSKL
mgnify:CR=1 FL=1